MTEAIDHHQSPAVPVPLDLLQALPFIIDEMPLGIAVMDTERRVVTHAREDLVAYVTFGARARGSVNGLQVRPGLMLAVEPGAEVTFVTDTGWESITLLLAPTEIRGHLTQRQRESEFHLPRGVETLQVTTEGARSLFDWGKRLVDTAERRPSLFDERRGERCAPEAELPETLLAAHSVASDFEPDRSDRTRQVYSHIVRSVEDYAPAHGGEIRSP